MPEFCMSFLKALTIFSVIFIATLSSYAQTINSRDLVYEERAELPSIKNAPFDANFTAVSYGFSIGLHFAVIENSVFADKRMANFTGFRWDFSDATIMARDFRVCNISQKPAVEWLPSFLQKNLRGQVKSTRKLADPKFPDSAESVFNLADDTEGVARLLITPDRKAIILVALYDTSDIATYDRVGKIFETVNPITPAESERAIAQLTAEITPDVKLAVPIAPFANYPDDSLRDMKGGVKTMTSYRLSDTKGNAPSFKNKFAEVHYDRHGNAVKKVQMYNGDVTQVTLSGIKEGAIYEVSRRAPKSVAPNSDQFRRLSYVYDDKGDLIEDLTYDDGKLSMRVMLRFEPGKILKTHITAFNDRVWLTETYLLNDLNNISELKRVNYLTRQTAETLYEYAYETFDKHGNWTSANVKMTSKISNEKKTYIYTSKIVRTLTYY